MNSKIVHILIRQKVQLLCHDKQLKGMLWRRLCLKWFMDI